MSRGRSYFTHIWIKGLNWYNQDSLCQSSAIYNGDPRWWMDKADPSGKSTYLSSNRKSHLLWPIQGRDHHCYGLNAYIPKNVYIEILTFNVMVLGDGVFGRYLGYMGEALTNGVHALIKETQENSLAPTVIWIYKGSLQPGQGPSPNHAGPWSWISQTPELWLSYL